MSKKARTQRRDAGRGHSQPLSAEKKEGGQTGAPPSKLFPPEPPDTQDTRSWRGLASCGLAVVAFSLPPLVTFNLDDVSFGDAITGKEYLLRFTALFWLIFVSGSLLSGYRITPTRRAIPLLALVALYLAWIPFSRYANYTVPKSTSIFTSATLFFALACLDQKGKTLVAGALVAGGAAAIALTTVMSFTPSAILTVSRESRFSMVDVFGNQNLYAMFLLCLIPMTVFAMLRFRERGMRGWAVSCMVLLALAGVHLLFSYSRGAYIGAAAAVVAWLMPFSLRKTLKYGAVTVIVGVITVTAIFALKERYPYFHRKLTDAPRAMAQRMEIWGVGARGFMENPVLGAGPGVLQVAALNEVSDDFIRRSRSGRLVDAHNDALTVAYETGAGGAAFYLAFMWLLLLEGYRRGDVFGKLAFTGFAGIFVTGLFNSVSVHASVLLFPMLLGAVIAGRDDYLTVRPPSPRRLTTALGAAGAGLCLFLVWWTYADLKELVGYSTLETAARTGNIGVAEVKTRLARIYDVYPQDPAHPKTEAWIALKEQDIPRFLTAAQKFYQLDPASHFANYDYGYALLLSGRTAEAEPYLRMSWRRLKNENNLLPALLSVTYHELGDEAQAAAFAQIARSDPNFVKPEAVLAKFREMKIVKK